MTAHPIDPDALRRLADAATPDRGGRRMSLPTLTPTVNGNKIDAVLAHMDDCHPEDAATARMWLSARIQGTYTYAHQDIADALTDYCRANNLGTGVSEASVRRYRKAQR